MFVEASWLLPKIWSPEHGFNWDMAFNYVLIGLLCMALKYIFTNVIDHVIAWLVYKTNTINFTIPVVGWKVDFNSYQWDDKFWEDIKAKAKTFVQAKQSEAEGIKLIFKTKLIEAGDNPEAQKKIVDEARVALEKLTTQSLQEIRHSDPLIWRALVSRMGDEVKAVAWLETKIKALVELQKTGSTGVLAAIADGLAEEMAKLGKDSLPKGSPG
jgi:hypothetical protein